MRKLIVQIVALCCVFAGGAGSHKLYVARHHPVKHTWECQMVQQASPGAFWFVRPNHELFEMYFDNPPILRPGMLFKDIAYTDDNADMRHFLAATLK
jgi:hypothetical protein